MKNESEEETQETNKLQHSTRIPDSVMRTPNTEFIEIFVSKSKIPDDTNRTELNNNYSKTERYPRYCLPLRINDAASPQKDHQDLCIS